MGGVDLMSCQGGILEVTGWTIVALVKTSFGMEKVYEEDKREINDENGDIKILFILFDHRVLYADNIEKTRWKSQV